MDRTHRSSRKSFLKWTSLSIAGALTLNKLAQERTTLNTESSVKCDIEKPVLTAQRAKGTVARSADV